MNVTDFAHTFIPDSCRRFSVIKHFIGFLSKVEKIFNMSTFFSVFKELLRKMLRVKSGRHLITLVTKKCSVSLLQLRCQLIGKA